MNSKFNKLKVIATISNSTKSQLEFSYVSWSGKSAKYDIRRWDSEGITPYKGVSLSHEELMQVGNLLDIALNSEKRKNPKYTYLINDKEVNIYESFGDYKKTNSMSGKVTYIAWGVNPKYDIRMWSEDYSICSKGITLTREESMSLRDLINNKAFVEIEDNEKSVADFDFDINADLFI